MKCIKGIMDSVALIGAANQDLNTRRRDQIKPDLNTQFRSLCSSQVPVTSLLFGDSLAQTLKDITETSKVGAKVGASSSSYKGKGGQPSSRGKHFLGRHRPQSGFRNHQYGGRGRSSYYHNPNSNSYKNPKKQTTQKKDRQ